jgi:hypothetical protein
MRRDVHDRIPSFPAQAFRTILSDAHLPSILAHRRGHPRASLQPKGFTLSQTCHLTALYNKMPSWVY